MNFNIPGVINLDSAVVITAAEFIRIDTPVLSYPKKTLGRPHLGDANIYVTNIGPHGMDGGETGGVEFVLHVDWDNPLDVMVTISVLEDIEIFTEP